MRSRTRAALVVVVASIALASSPTADATASRDSGGSAAGGDAFISSATRIGGTLTRPTGADRAEITHGERPQRQRLGVAAVLAVLVAAVLVGRRGAVPRPDGVERPATPRWSPEAGRSPPSLFSFV